MIFDTPAEAPPLSGKLRRALFWGVLPFVAAVRNAFAARAAERDGDPDAAWLRRIAALDALTAVCIVLSGLVANPERRQAAPQERRAIGLRHTTPVEGGVRIDDVLAGAPAAEAGLRVGDVIDQVDGSDVASPDAVSKALQRGGPHVLRFRRGHGFATAVVEPVPFSRLEAYFGVFDTTGPPPEMALRGIVAQYAKALAAPGALIVLVAFVFRRRGAGWRVPALLLLAQAVTASVAAAALAVTFRSTGGTSWGAVLVAMCATSSGLLACAWLIWRSRKSLGLFEPPPSALAARDWAKPGLLAAVLLLTRTVPIGRYLAASTTAWRLGWSPLDHVRTMPHAVLPLLLVPGVVLAPLGEELLFRGVLHGWLRRFASAPVAIAAGALVFALFHLHYGVEAIVIFGMGCVLGWIRERSGTLRAPVAVHAGYNALLLGLKILATALG